MDNMNTKNKDIITSFVLIAVLHHVGMLWIMGKKLECDTEKQNS